MFDPETLRTFIGVAETGSFSRRRSACVKPRPRSAIVLSFWKKTPVSRCFFVQPEA